MLNRRISRPLGGAALVALGLALAGTASANHPVLVEGEADFDGDGLLGADEDGDGDQVFGTIMGGVNGVSDNGRVIVVTSGRFFETVVLQGAGITVLEAAPGVEADIDAFRAGDDEGVNNARQMAPGIVVDSDGSFPVVIRNIVSRNWTSGIQIQGDSRVVLDDVKLDSNVNYGVLVKDGAQAVITDSHVDSSGFRRSGSLGLTPGGDVPPNPGTGIAFVDHASGVISNTTVTYSFATGIGIATSGDVHLDDNTVFGNGRDYEGGGGRGMGGQGQGRN